MASTEAICHKCCNVIYKGKMKIGVFYPSYLPFSIYNYIQNVSKIMGKLGADIIFFSENETIPEDVDIYWDPRAMAGSYPYVKILSTRKPIVLTLHGVSPFSVPAKEHYDDFKKMLKGKIDNLTKFAVWQFIKKKISTIITPSYYAKSEIKYYLKLRDEKITVIYHGVDLKIFKPKPRVKKDYFLHISQYQPKKNIRRIIRAYKKLPFLKKPKLIILSPGYPYSVSHKDILFITKSLKPNELVSLYQGALAFVFPSLHESFGMPLLEAMACGCPVITANVTACPEIAGDAAIYVNPRSENSIMQAMLKIMEDKDLRNVLCEKGLKHVKKFRWDKSAEKHFSVFKKIVYNKND